MLLYSAGRIEHSTNITLCYAMQPENIFSIFNIMCCKAVCLSGDMVLYSIIFYS